MTSLLGLVVLRHISAPHQFLSDDFCLPLKTVSHHLLSKTSTPTTNRLSRLPANIVFHHLLAINAPKGNARPRENIVALDSNLTDTPLTTEICDILAIRNRNHHI
jgi:hypothetical protein